MGLQDLLHFGEIKDAVVEIIEAKIQLKKLELQEKAEEAIAGLVYNFLVAASILLCLIFILLLCAYFLNLWLGAPWGYVVVLGLTIILLLVLKSQKNSIQAKIQTEIMKEMDAMN